MGSECYKLNGKTFSLQTLNSFIHEKHENILFHPTAGAHFCRNHLLNLNWITWLDPTRTVGIIMISWWRAIRVDEIFEMLFGRMLFMDFWAPSRFFGVTDANYWRISTFSDRLRRRGSGWGWGGERNCCNTGKNSTKHASKDERKKHKVKSFEECCHVSLFRAMERNTFFEQFFLKSSIFPGYFLEKKRTEKNGSNEADFVTVKNLWNKNR